MAIELAVTLATLLVKDEYLITLDEGRDDFAYDLGTIHGGEAYLYFAAVVHEQYFLKFNSLTILCTADVVDKELLALFSTELLTVNLYDCVHCWYDVNGFFREADCIHSHFVLPRRTLKSAAKLLLFSHTQVFGHPFYTSPHLFHTSEMIQFTIGYGSATSSSCFRGVRGAVRMLCRRRLLPDELIA